MIGHNSFTYAILMKEQVRKGSIHVNPPYPHEADFDLRHWCFIRCPLNHNSIFDCHTICTAIADAYVREGRGLDTEPLIWYVTASLAINYHKPTPIDKPVTLKADIIGREGKKSTVACELYSDDIKRAEAEVLAVRVSPERWY